ncbi:ATP-binding cassette subfamily B protein [Saccharopolyspora erythraea NRRL 2338]|uniref:ABC transporter protein, ATP-binding component n=2 Tax=Saccharopolyspora erythraea TaxID=1836 RepID=A4FGX4_SACEN|nr:ABC transporter ATP-binding protein [Saccharopolyspora erythraea]PFG97002.1 ATP-binding cassette subfamily B protein [Saccharopolyspora erythraea NRRL 2338]QRK87216.1 ABC transporter ATP-binding protein [Saccharopolyspora erythraea]CAM03299.1 ABC transporter protein, ATP-binding component [Saccharopolyspora erythraea NRRL 2338]
MSDVAMAPPRRRGFARFLPLERAEGENAAAGRALLAECLRECPLWSSVLVPAVIARTAAALLLPAAVAEGIDAAVSGAGVATAVVHVGVVLTVLSAAEAAMELANAYYKAAVTADLRNRFIRHVLALGVAGRRRFASGDLLSRLTTDTAKPAGFLLVLLNIAVGLLTLAGCAVALWIIDWTLALTLLVGIPVAFGMVRLFVSRTAKHFLRYQQIQADIVARFLDALRGARTIRANGNPQRDAARVLRPLGELNITGRAVWKAQGQIGWQLLLLISLLQIAVLCVGGFALTAERITAGEFVASAGYVLLAVHGFEAVESIVMVLKSHIGATRVATVLSTPAREPGSPVVPDIGAGRLDLRGVTVRDGDRVVLDNVYLRIPAGSNVAAVGRSGSGKSVLAAVAGRLVHPSGGSVTFDGVAFAELSESALRASVAYAFEKPALLGRTIHDAIAYGRPGASRAEVERAARIARADHFVRKLPAGYDTPVREARFSGGEVQRLGLARAVLVDARLVILDDATSSLDAATEVQVAHAFDRVLAGRTCLLVAHRASTAARADLVAWLDEGRVRGFAPHAQLWSDPAYREVFGG